MCLHNNILNKSCMECVLTIPPQLNFCRESGAGILQQFAILTVKQLVGGMATPINKQIISVKTIDKPINNSQMDMYLVYPLVN